MKREPDFLIGPSNDPYIRRFWLIPRNRVFNVYLHNIRRDDDERALHDHPWVNVSIVLKGHLEEVRPNGKRTLRKFFPYFRRSTDSHRLVVNSKRDTADLPKNVWTLFLTGPRIREWGFHCPKGWVHWLKFVNPESIGEIGSGCGED